MQYLQNIQTSILKAMVSAHAAYYGRVLTGDETADCIESINLLKLEIEARKKYIPVLHLSARLKITS